MSSYLLMLIELSVSECGGWLPLAWAAEGEGFHRCVKGTANNSHRKGAAV